MEVKQKHINGGRQRLYRFDNGRGVSVVCHRFSYGHEQGKWELALLRFPPECPEFEGFDLDYSSELTHHDVVGHLSWEEAEDLIRLIEAMPAPKPGESTERPIFGWYDDAEAN